jgi:hypothetical protein
MIVMIGGMQRMPMSNLGMVRGFFVITGLGVLGGLAMVLCCMLVVVRSLFMVLVNVVTVHCRLPVSGFGQCRSIVAFNETFATCVRRIVTIDQIDRDNETEPIGAY